MTKFDVNNLPKMKLTVLTQEDNVRATKALEVICAKAGIGIRNMARVSMQWNPVENCLIFYPEVSSSVKGFAFYCREGYFKEYTSHEVVTLEELEALAYQGMTPTIVTWIKQEVHVEGECDNCGCGVGLKADVTEQAKNRFNAARKHLYAAASDFNKVLKKNQQVIECPTVDLVKALRIASGLELIPSSKS